MEIKTIGIEALKQAVLKTSNNDLYIPLQGKHTTNPEEEPFDLAQKINEFFVFDDANPKDPRVMLLMGDTGSGKSVFAQQVFQQLWKMRQANDPIPLWISLPELLNPFEGAVEEILKKYEFTESQILELKTKEKFIFIVDGYDELHHFQNCYVTNRWHEWNAKVLITCRSQALYYQKDPDKYFMPFNGVKSLPMLLRKLYVAAFSELQIRSYIKKYQQLNTEHKISELDFAKVPGLTELIKTPFLLYLAVEALPEIMAAQIDDQKITQAKLYDIFIGRWFTRQVKKLSDAGLLTDTEQNTKQQFWSYCKILAQKMHEKEVSVIPYTGQKVGGRLFGKQDHINIWEHFFNEETEVLRSACPLRRYGEHNYGFIHATMVEYFATRAMYEEIQVDTQNERDQALLSKEKEPIVAESTNDSPKKNNLSQGGIHQRLFAQERQAIQFLADRIEMSQAFKQKMLSIVESSKRSARFAIGAANAITALVRAGVTFNNQNLSEIKISGADISGGFFDQADLSAADLGHAQMRNVWLREANLDGSHLEGINFGEFPWYKQDNEVLCFDYREDLQRCVSVSGKDVILWDTDAVNAKLLKTLRGHSDVVRRVQFSPNGKWIVSGSDDKTIRIWEVATGKEIRVIRGNEYAVKCIACSPNGQYVASGDINDAVHIWDIVNGKEFAKLRGHTSNVTCLQFNHNGERLISGSADHSIRIWDVDRGKSIATLYVRYEDHRYEEGVVCIAFSPDGEQIVSGSSDAKIRFWNVRSQKLTAVLDGHEGYVSCVAFSQEGDRLVSAGHDDTVRVWDTISKQVILVLRGHHDRVCYVQFSQDAKQVISGSLDKTLRIWDVGSGPYLARARGHVGFIRSIEFSQDGRVVSTGSDDNTVRIWEIESGKESGILVGHKGGVWETKFSPNGKWVVSCDWEGMVRLWEVESGRMVRVLLKEVKTAAVVFSSDGDLVMVGASSKENTDHSIRILEMSSGKELMLLRGYDKFIFKVAFSQDRKRVFSASADNTLRVLEVSSGRELARWHYEDLSCVSFSSDKDWAAYYGSEHVRIIDMKNGKKIFEMPVENELGSIHFIRGSQCLIMNGDKTIEIWGIANRQRLNILTFHNDVKVLSYHDQGTLMLSFIDNSIFCFQITSTKNNNHLELRWSTNIDSSALNVAGLKVSKVIGLNDQNRRVLEQRGAIVVAKSEPVALQPTATPIQQAPTKQPTKVGFFFKREFSSTISKDPRLTKKPLPTPPDMQSVNPQSPIPAKRDVDTVTPISVAHSTMPITDQSHIKHQPTSSTFTTSQPTAVKSKRPGFLNTSAPKPPVKGTLLKDKIVKNDDNSHSLAKK